MDIWYEWDEASYNEAMMQLTRWTCDTITHFRPLGIRNSNVYVGVAEDRYHFAHSHNLEYDTEY
jgi:hypothetical protein